MSRSTDHDEDEGEYIDAEEYLQHALMNETKAYFDRGRRFANVDVAQLKEKWVVIFKAYFADHNRQQGLEMDDLAAELRLRGLDPPFEAVKAEISKLQGALRARPSRPSNAYCSAFRSNRKMLVSSAFIFSQ